MIITETLGMVGQDRDKDLSAKVMAVGEQDQAERNGVPGGKRDLSPFFFSSLS